MAKFLALVITLVGFVLVIFIAGAIASVAIAGVEEAAVHWPTAWELVRAVAAGWFVLVVWAALGVLLAVLSGGTALAIGLGIVYTFVIEGILSALAGEASWLQSLVEYFLRANAYLLVTAVGVRTAGLTDRGPGSFLGPFVDGSQAIIVMVAYLTAFLMISGLSYLRRDVQ